MNIIRKGKKYKLTEDELYEAYLEQRNIFNKDNITENLERFVSSEEYEALIGNQEFIEKAASILQKYQYDYDCDYEYSLSAAIDEAKADLQQNCSRIN